MTLESAKTRTGDDTPESLEILWRWLTVPLFLYCAGLWIRSQSDNYEIINFVAKDHDVAIVSGLFAIPVAFVSLWLASQYAKRVLSLRLVDRIPRTLEKGLDGKTGDLFRIALFFGPWVIILGAEIHFIESVLSGSVVDTTPAVSVVVARGWKQLLATWPIDYADDFRFGGEHGPSFFPVLQPWCCLLGVITLLVCFIRYFAGLVRRRSGIQVNSGRQ